MPSSSRPPGVASATAPIRSRRAGVGPPSRSAAAAPRPPSIEDAVEAYIRWKGYSATTANNCRYYLCHGRFSAFRRAEGVELMADLTGDHVSRFLGLLAAVPDEDGRPVGLSRATRRHYTSYLRGLLEFCATVPGYATRATVAEVPKPPKAKGRRLIDALTPDEERRLVAACTSERDSLFVRFLLATGLRTSEASGLLIDDLLLARRPPQVRVARSSHDREVTKSTRDRVVPFRQPYQGLPVELQRWLTYERPRTHRREVFLSSNTAMAPMSTNAIKLLFQRLSLACGIHVHAHQMRHTWATRLAEAGASPYDLMVAGGWSSLDMVMVYFTAREQEAIARLANTLIRG